MTTQTHFRMDKVFRQFSRFSLATIGAYLGAYYREKIARYEARMELEKLADLPDYLLADMGIRREDISSQKAKLK